MPEMSLPAIVSQELSRTAWIRVASYEYSVEPGARPIEEVYEQPHIVLLHGGVVQCRTSRSPVTLFPGAVLLANARVPHEYSYQPGWPERCVSFAYDPRVFEDILRNLGVASARFHSLSLAPSARFAAIAQLLVSGDSRESAEEWAYALAAEVLENQAGRGGCKRAQLQSRGGGRDRRRAGHAVSTGGEGKRRGHHGPDPRR